MSLVDSDLLVISKIDYTIPFPTSSKVSLLYNFKSSYIYYKLL